MCIIEKPVFCFLTPLRSGTTVTIDARRCELSAENRRPTLENYSVTLVRMRWPERERTIVEKGAAACECISSMKEEIRLLVGQIDDLECRLDEETADLSQQLDRERGTAQRLEAALQASAARCAQCERERDRLATECEQARQLCADGFVVRDERIAALEAALRVGDQTAELQRRDERIADLEAALRVGDQTAELQRRDKRIAALEATLQGRMKEMARTLEEQTSVAQLLRVRQNRLAEGYDAKVRELAETSQAVINSMEHVKQARAGRQPPLKLLRALEEQVAQLRAAAADRFRRLDEGAQAAAAAAEAAASLLPLAPSGGGGAAEYVGMTEAWVRGAEEVVGYLENDLTLMRSISGAGPAVATRPRPGAVPLADSRRPAHRPEGSADVLHLGCAAHTDRICRGAVLQSRWPTHGARCMGQKGRSEGQVTT
jgi:hypothetical protein